jgi:lipopolysaccharide export system protein LptA
MDIFKQILLYIMIVNPLVVISEEKIEKFTHKVSDTLEHLHINSEDLVIDKLKMTANFTGNVVMCFDNVQLSGQKAVFLF